MVTSIDKVKQRKSLARVAKFFFILMAVVIISGVWVWAITGMAAKIIVAWLFTVVFAAFGGMLAFGLSMAE